MIDLFQALIQAVQDLLTGKADRRQGLIVVGATLIAVVLLTVLALSVFLIANR